MSLPLRGVTRAGLLTVCGSNPLINLAIKVHRPSETCEYIESAGPDIPTNPSAIQPLWAPHPEPHLPRWFKAEWTTSLQVRILKEARRLWLRDNIYNALQSRVS